LLIESCLRTTRERRTRQISENGGCESTLESHARMMGVAMSVALQLAACSFYCLLSFSLLIFSFSFHLFSSVFKLIPTSAKNMHAHTHVPFFVRSRGHPFGDLVNTPPSQCRIQKTMLACANVGLRSNRVVQVIIINIIMLAYPSPNASHGRLGNAQRDRSERKRGGSWSVGEVGRVC
jgi:hypothetical protein